MREMVSKYDVRELVCIRFVVQLCCTNELDKWYTCLGHTNDHCEVEHSTNCFFFLFQAIYFALKKLDNIRVGGV